MKILENLKKDKVTLVISGTSESDNRKTVRSFIKSKSKCKSKEIGYNYGNTLYEVDGRKYQINNIIKNIDSEMNICLIK